MCCSALGQWASGVCLSGNRKKKRKEQRDRAWLIIISVQQENTTGRLPPFPQHTTPQAHSCITELQSCSNLWIAFVLSMLLRLCGLVCASRGITVTGRYEQFKIWSVLCSSCLLLFTSPAFETVFVGHVFIPVPVRIYIFSPHLGRDIFSAPCQNTAVSSCVCMRSLKLLPCPRRLEWSLQLHVLKSCLPCCTLNAEPLYNLVHQPRGCQAGMATTLPLILPSSDAFSSFFFLFHPDHHLLPSSYFTRPERPFFSLLDCSSRAVESWLNLWIATELQQSSFY